MTTKKGYIAIAAAVRAERENWGKLGSEWHQGARAGTELVAMRVANIFAADNERFDRARFLAACGVE